jgi:hypothetical protein
LPRAATVYVAEVLGTAVLLANLDRFGLDTVKRAEPTSVSELDVPSGTSLPLVARAASVAPTTLRELNPEYGSDVVPTTSFPMVVHVPSDTLARARELLPLLQDGKEIGAEADGGGIAEAGVPSVRPVISRGTDQRMFYRVKEGDTLPSLARENGISVDTIASDNALDSTSSLRPGMILAIRLPEPAASAGASPSPKNVPPPKNRKKPAH